MIDDAEEMVVVKVLAETKLVEFQDPSQILQLLYSVKSLKVVVVAYQFELLQMVEALTMLMMSTMNGK